MASPLGKDSSESSLLRRMVTPESHESTLYIRVTQALGEITSAQFAVDIDHEGNAFSITGKMGKVNEPGNNTASFIAKTIADAAHCEREQVMVVPDGTSWYFSAQFTVDF